MNAQPPRPYHPGHQENHDGVDSAGRIPREQRLRLNGLIGEQAGPSSTLGCDGWTLGQLALRHRRRDPDR